MVNQNESTLTVRATDTQTKELSMQFFTQKVGHLMLTIISILLAGILALVTVLLTWSYPESPNPSWMKTEIRWRAAFPKSILSTSTVWNKGCLSRAKMQQSSAALPAWGYAGLLPDPEIPDRS